jgi:hypothetical protein
MADECELMSDNNESADDFDEDSECECLVHNQYYIPFDDFSYGKTMPHRNL